MALSVQAVIAQTCDRWLSGPAGHSSAQAVIAQTRRDAVPERALLIAADGGRRCSGWASGVLGGVLGGVDR